MFEVLFPLQLHKARLDTQGLATYDTLITAASNGAEGSGEAPEVKTRKISDRCLLPVRTNIDA